MNRTAALAALLLGLATAPAASDVRLSGTEDHIVLRTNNATLSEIIADLEAAFPVRINLSGSTARQFSGVYSGSIRVVLKRLLDGSDYVVATSPGTIRIAILDRAGSARPGGLPAAVVSPMAQGGSRQSQSRQMRIQRALGAR
jgi:hypothetical protein